MTRKLTKAPANHEVRAGRVRGTFMEMFYRSRARPKPGASEAITFVVVAIGLGRRDGLGWRNEDHREQDQRLGAL
jgi:hypothetical protein